MKVASNDFIVTNLLGTYAFLGEHEFKISLNPKKFKNSQSADVHLLDSDGRAIGYALKRWGRKIVCTFWLDENVSDGVAAVKLTLCDAKNRRHDHMLHFWVIK